MLETQVVRSLDRCRPLWAVVLEAVKGLVLQVVMVVVVVVVQVGRGLCLLLGKSLPVSQIHLDTTWLRGTPSGRCWKGWDNLNRQ